MRLKLHIVKEFSGTGPRLYGFPNQTRLATLEHDSLDPPDYVLLQKRPRPVHINASINTVVYRFVFNVESEISLMFEYRRSF